MMIEDINFPHEIETYVKENGGTYVEAVLFICEEYDIDPVFVAKTLTKPIIEKLEVEGRELNILPQLTSSKLPI
jgi:hypothetical protein